MYFNVRAFYSSLVKDCRLAIESSNFQIFNQRTLKILLCLTLVTRPLLKSTISHQHKFGRKAGASAVLLRREQMLSSLSVFTREFSKVRNYCGPLLTSNQARDFTVNVSLHWSILLHILKMFKATDHFNEIVTQFYFSKIGKSLYI